MSEPAITVRLPAKLREQLSRQAKAARRTRSAIVVQALEDYLERRHHGYSQAEIDAEMRRLNELDRQDPDYQAYLEGDEDPWGDDDEGKP